jgi:hypothetical protein
MAQPDPAPPRSPDLRLAALHVRTGGYALARVELETLAGTDALDAAGVLDLAEVRWRTGDLAGAEAAAAAWLDEAGDAEDRGVVLANAICAEAAVARGDVDAAAAHVAAASAGMAAAGALEALLAGIRTRAAWPSREKEEEAAGPEVEAAGLEPAGPRAAVSAPAPASAGGGAAGIVPPPTLPLGPPLASAAASLVERGAALLAAQPERAAVLLALALRADRAAAEAVLAALDASQGLPGAAPVAAGGPGAATVAFVRAEALRAAGRHEEARITYASAERLALEPAEAGPPGSAQ